MGFVWREIRAGVRNRNQGSVPVTIQLRYQLDVFKKEVKKKVKYIWRARSGDMTLVITGRCIPFPATQSGKGHGDENVDRD